MNKDTSKVCKFLDDIDWLFAIQNFDRNIVLKEKDEDNKCAEITFEEDYQRITVNIYPTFFKQTDKEQRKALLHELCHTITIPMNQLSIDFIRGKAVTEETFYSTMERATSQIENILDGLLRGRFKYASKAYQGFVKGKNGRTKK